MASRKTSKSRKETPEQTLARWIAGSRNSSYREITEAGWEAGQVGCMEITHSDGCTMNYEKFHFEDGTYAVVEWDNDGNISCCK